MPHLDVPRVLGAGRIIVCVMVGEKGVSTKDVRRAHKVAPTSARRMVEEEGALGDSYVRRVLVL